MKKFLILTSTEDSASMNIRENFFKCFELHEKELRCCGYSLYKFCTIFPKGQEKEEPFDSEVYLALTDESMIHMSSLNVENSAFEPDLIIIASRHRSKAGKPALLAHTTGNWGHEAEFGGNPQQLSRTSGILHKAGFFSLIEKFKTSSLDNFSLDIEITHHGPTELAEPLIFMELGSSKKEWGIPKGGEMIASSILNAIIKYLDYEKKKSQSVAVGFGGTHYAPNFHRLIRNKDIAMSFICPKYFIQDLNYDLIEMMIENTLEKVDYFIVDWKGTNSADKQHLMPLLKEFDIPIKKTKDF